MVFVIAVICAAGNLLFVEAPGRAAGLASAPAFKQYALVNGRWFNGHQFQEDRFYVVDGRLTRKQPAHVDETIDLQAGFVVPPFGEAHNHNVEGLWDLDAVVARYLHDGVFYVKNPNSIREFTAQIAPRINNPTSIDVVFANAGLTSSDGHPVPLYEQVLRESRYRTAVGEVPTGWFNNRGYVLIDSELDLQKKWSTLTEGQPDFVKVFLVHSEDTAQHRQAGGSSGRKGLDPGLVPSIVERAHRAGLRVSAHVETAADFRVALSAGVDELAHVPGWFLDQVREAERMVLTEEDARLAAKAGVVITTTTVAMKPAPAADARHEGIHDPQGGHGQSKHASSMDPATWSQARDLQARNIRLLHRQGVKLAIGSDHAETSLAEALHLHELGLFDNLTLLRLWCEDTPRSIFPDRRIGRLDEGYEASLLVLSENPIEHFQAVTHIDFRMKQGRVLHAGR